MKVIVDHDGGVDDYPAFSLLLCTPSIRVVAITVMPATSYREPAVAATKKIADYLGARNVTIAATDFAGIHPFPAEWRSDSYRMATLAELDGLEPEPTNQVLDVPADQHLAELLSGSDRLTVLATGPLTNLARAFAREPSVVRNVERIYVMGGALSVAGNVSRPGHDGSAEWNFHNDPESAAAVLESGVPITLFPLDVTGKVPLRRAFLERLRAQSEHRASRLAVAAWDLAAKYIDAGGYYFWDTLTSAALAHPGVVETEPRRLSVVTCGVSQGRTIETAEGARVDVALEADQGAVESLFLETFRT